MQDVLWAILGLEESRIYSGHVNGSLAGEICHIWLQLWCFEMVLADGASVSGFTLKICWKDSRFEVYQQVSGIISIDSRCEELCGVGMFLHIKWCSMYLPILPLKKRHCFPQNWNWTWIQRTEKHQKLLCDENVNVCHILGRCLARPAGGFEKNVIHFDKTAKVMRVLGGIMVLWEWEKTQIFEQKRGKWLDGELKTKRLNEMFLFTCKRCIYIYM